jgi:hypothetical protein
VLKAVPVIVSEVIIIIRVTEEPVSLGENERRIDGRHW